MNIKFDFWEEMKPIKFYPYAHIVTDRIISAGDMNKEYKELEKNLVQQFNEAGIKAYNDNKTVFELETETGQHVFVSFKDWTFSIGFGCREI